MLSKLKDFSLEQIKDFSKEKWAIIMKYANAAGSLTTTKQGAIPALPSEKEIQNLVG